jgi:hypothetical protein
MGFWSKLWQGIKKGGRKLFGVADTGRKMFENVFKKAKQIPVVGNILKSIEESPIGKQISNIGTAINAGNKAVSGDVKGGAKELGNLRLKKGGMVPQMKDVKIGSSRLRMRPPQFATMGMMNMA